MFLEEHTNAQTSQFPDCLQTVRGIPGKPGDGFHKVFECSSYEEALNVLGEYVTITSSQQEEQMDLRMQ